jgi:hypothetical protein
MIDLFLRCIKIKLQMGTRLNHMESKDYLRILVEGLSSGKLLPSNIRAKIVAVEPQYTTGDRRFSPDLIVEFTAEDANSKSVQAASNSNLISVL